MLKLPVFDRRFSSVGIETIQGLGLDELGRAMIGAAAPGHTRYTDGQGEGRIVGFAPMKTRPWTVGFELPEAEFSLPLVSLIRSALLSVLLVSLGVSAIALRLVRSLVRPLLDLTRAARAVRDEPGLRIDSLGPLQLKGRAEPVDVSGLHAEDSGAGSPERRAG